MLISRILTTAAAVALTAGLAQAQPAPATPPAKAAEAATTSKSPPQVAPAGDIVDTAKASGQFSTFLKAAEATNLTTLLKTNKNLTVFAPTDAAFAALPPGELDKLMLPENKAQLQKLLIYHIINAPVRTADFKGATRTAPTVAGPSVSLAGGEALKVNDANIVQADISATNGVIHVIDKVLSPTTVPSAGAAGAPASTTAPAGSTAPTSTATETKPKSTTPKDKLSLSAANAVGG